MVYEKYLVGLKYKNPVGGPYDGNKPDAYFPPMPCIISKH